MENEYNAEEPQQLFKPVWFSCYWVENALSLYDGISGKHAKALNEKGHGHFFGLVQTFSIDSAIMGLCRIYDRTNKKYAQHTIDEVASYLQSNIHNAMPRNLNTRLLKELGFSEEEINQTTLTDYNGKPLNPELLKNILSKKPTISTDAALDRVFTYRDKKLAHQEQLDEVLKEQLSNLPSLEDLKRLNLWAYAFCKFFNDCMSRNSSIVDSAISSRMSALNVIKKVLNFNSKDYIEDKEFYDR